MDAWTTAINLRGLFGESLPADKAALVTPDSSVPVAVAVARPTSPRGGRSWGLRSVVVAVQLLLWGTCVLIVLVGALLFTRAFLAARDAVEEASAAAVFSTFLIAAYVLARCGEKLSRLLITLARRRPR
jgi:hypothetical protein